jgi:hypothetical protein
MNFAEITSMYGRTFGLRCAPTRVIKARICPISKTAARVCDEPDLACRRKRHDSLYGRRDDAIGPACRTLTSSEYSR